MFTQSTGYRRQNLNLAQGSSSAAEQGETCVRVVRAYVYARMRTRMLTRMSSHIYVYVHRTNRVKAVEPNLRLECCGCTG